MVRRERISDVNMTPLVDVMLVVLVLFLITSPLLLPGPRVSLPDVEADVIPLDDAEVVITVTSDGVVYFRQTPIEGDLADWLLRDAAFQRSRTVYVRGDRDASFGDVSRVLNMVQRLVPGHVNLVVDPKLLESSTAK